MALRTKNLGSMTGVLERFLELDFGFLLLFGLLSEDLIGGLEEVLIEVYCPKVAYFELSTRSFDDKLSLLFFIQSLSRFWNISDGVVSGPEFYVFILGITSLYPSFNYELLSFYMNSAALGSG